VIAHSDKEQATPTWKKTFGFHPLTAWADHGAAGNGEPLAIMLRAGNAGSNTATDHVEATRLALAQLPHHLRRKVLVRADSGGGTHDFLDWLTAQAQEAGLLHRDDHHRGDPGGDPAVPGRRLDPGLRRRREGQGGRLGRRRHRDAGPGRLA
jgi:hypothetical protein